jgi:DNA-binding response OmpR family regulator
MTTQLLVVDDDRDSLELLSAFLSKRGYNVFLGNNGNDMWKLLNEHSIDMIILDLQFPGEDSFDLTQRLRRTSDIPMIMLSGRNDIVDRVLGLEYGADDYMVKPYSPRELVARIATVLRRTVIRDAFSRSRTSVDTRVFNPAFNPLARFCGWTLDANLNRLISPTGKEVGLTSGEHELLSVFIKNCNRVLSRNQILSYCKPPGDEPFDRSIDIRIMRLRRKIESNPRNPVMISTVRSRGYIFTPNIE